MNARALIEELTDCANDFLWAAKKAARSGNHELANEMDRCYERAMRKAARLKEQNA